MNDSSSEFGPRATGRPSTDVSLTALLVAGNRWLAGREPDPLCEDRWAGDLIGPRGRELAERLDGESTVNKVLVALRTRHFDRQVRHHVGEPGVRQVVILGAGLDTRAARLATPGVRFFEVDRESTQAHKLRRLRDLADYPVEAARYVACDLEEDELLSALAAEGFDADRPALFLLEGLLPYVAEGSVRRILAEIAASAHGESRVIFDYLRSDSFGPAGSTETLVALASNLRRQEPVRWLCDDPTPLLHASGYRYVRTLPLQHLCLQHLDLARSEALRPEADRFLIAHATRTPPPEGHVRW